MMFRRRRDPEPNSDYQRLENQIQWYDTRSGGAQRGYKTAKIAELILAAAIPITSLLPLEDHWRAAIASLCGAAIIVIEGLCHLNQWQHNWITYRSTCEALRHEKYTYLEKAGPYKELADPDARKELVDRVESLISTEHSKWIASQEHAARPRPTK